MSKHKYDKYIFQRSFKTGLMTRVKVLQQDALDVYVNLPSNENILLLNMANAYIPGGQYNLQKNNRLLMGQEESLFARTNLEEHLSKKLYPIRDDEVILTKGIRCHEVESDVDIISCPAIDMRYKQYGTTLDPQTHGKMYVKISTIFQVALQNNYTTLILGALGCGGFAMPPEAVSKIFRMVIKEYEGCFKEIIFAIKSEENHPKNNYNVFKNEMEK